jgi:hypothetical protein
LLRQFVRSSARDWSEVLEAGKAATANVAPRRASRCAAESVRGIRPRCREPRPDRLRDRTSVLNLNRPRRCSREGGEGSRGASGVGAHKRPVAGRAIDHGRLSRGRLPRPPGSHHRGLPKDRLCAAKPPSPAGNPAPQP